MRGVGGYIFKRLTPVRLPPTFWNRVTCKLVQDGQARGRCGWDGFMKSLSINTVRKDHVCFKLAFAINFSCKKDSFE